MPRLSDAVWKLGLTAQGAVAEWSEYPSRAGQGIPAGDSEPISEGSGRAARFPSKVLGSLYLAADVLERQQTLCFVVMAIFLVPLVWIGALSHPLTNDEIYTVHIAQAPNLRAMLALSREIDLHPPVHYLVERLALLMPLPRLIAARLPSMLAAVVVCWSMFRYSSRRMGNVFGLVAVGVFWMSPAIAFAWSNRPYMLWLAWLCLLLLARDAALKRDRKRWAIPTVFAVATLMVFTHLLGVACLFAFLGAEGLRWRRTRRLDLPLLCALILPGLGGLQCYYQMHHMLRNAFPVGRIPSLDMALDVYGGFFGNALLVLASCTLAATLLLGMSFRSRSDSLHLVPVPVRRDGEGRTESEADGFSYDDVALLSGLFLVPLLLLGAARMVHLQFWARYGLAALPAGAALISWLIARHLPGARVVALLLIASSCAYTVSLMPPQPDGGENPGLADVGRQPIALSALDASLPIVAASPMTFVEMSDRETEPIARRVFYLTDRDAALQYAHYTLFENEDKIRQMLHLPSQTEALAPFVAEHKRFYVVGPYGQPEVWLLRKLAAEGFVLDYLGKFQSTYESQDLYLVWH